MKDGAHTHGHGGPDLFPVVMAFVMAVLAFAAFEWVAARPWWELAGMAIILVLAAAGAWRVRCAIQRMKAADQAQIASIRTLRAEALPQAVQGTAPPAVEQHVHYHYHAVAGPEAARVVRQALPGREER